MFRKFFSTIGDKIKKDTNTSDEREVDDDEPVVYVTRQASQTFNIDSRESIAQEKQP